MPLNAEALRRVSKSYLASRHLFKPMQPLYRLRLGSINVCCQAKFRSDLYTKLLGVNVFGADDQHHDNHAFRFLCPLFNHQKAVN